jgi:hypothetical protein
MNTTGNKPPSPWRGIAIFSLDLWLGAAAISAVSYLLFRWSADFFSLSSFWGSEPTPFGQFVNIIKTAAFIILFIGLFALGSDAERSRLSHSLLFAYAFVGSQTGPPLKHQEVLKIRFLAATIGGCIFSLLIALLFLPWLSALNVLPENMTLRAEPIRISLPPKSISLKPGDSIESTLQDNLFSIRMKEGQEYLIILEPTNQEHGKYGISFPFTGVSQGELSIIQGGITFRDRFEWAIVTVPKNHRIYFEVLLNQAGIRSPYIVHVLENVTTNPDILTISSSELEDGRNNDTLQIQAQKDKKYLIFAWAMNEEESVLITLDEEYGRHYPSHQRSQTDLALLTPTQSGPHNITIYNPHGNELKGYNLLILPIN